MRLNNLVLDPAEIDESVRQLTEAFDLLPEDMTVLRQVVALFPHDVSMYVDDLNAPAFENSPLIDRFTFDMETDELILLSRDRDTLIDALIEMAMYVTGFTTMMGNDEIWVIEFTIGSWKPVKKTIKRQIGIPVQDRPRGVVGLPPPPDKAPADDSYPFRTLVSQYNLASFYQMVVLAARDDIAVYFPPETHSKVLAVYVYMRRAMQEVARGIVLSDYQTFNARLIQEIQRLQQLFDPASLTLPDWLYQQGGQQNTGESVDRLGMFPDNTLPDSRRQTKHDPFEAFVEQLFSDEETDRDNTDGESQQ